MVDFKKLSERTDAERDAAREEMQRDHYKKVARIRSLVDDLLDIDQGLTDWEVNFAESVSRQFDERGTLSQKQLATVEKILAEKGN